MTMLRFAILLAIAMTAAFAARDALTGSEPFNVHSAVLAGSLAIVFLAVALGVRTKA
jgi:hypothetical protein